MSLYCFGMYSHLSRGSWEIVTLSNPNTDAIIVYEYGQSIAFLKISDPKEYSLITVP
jgi:hypothetical protein